MRVHGGRKRKIGIALGAGALVVLAAALLLRPWADSAMDATVTVLADGEASRVVFRAKRLFSEAATSQPVTETTVDLDPWAGKLVKFEVEGTVRRRGFEGSSTGYVACTADLMTPEGSEPIQFLSWQHGAEKGLHMRPVGPVAYMVMDGKEDRFAFARTGGLWHCLWVPESAQLRIRLKPMPTDKIVGAMKPNAPVLAKDRSTARLPVRRPERPPDVYIYSMDALRPDHLGCYGYERGTSPNIDAFAREATVFERGYTPTPWTRASISSMLSGLYPSVHGAMHYSEGLADWPELIPEVLHEAGYFTAGFVTIPCIASPYGLDQGYDRYEYRLAAADWITAKVSRALASQPLGRPVFMFLHAQGPHDPYIPRPEDLKRFDRGFKGRYDGTSESLEKLWVPYPDLTSEDLGHIVDRYDGEVWETDEGVRDFLQVLKRAGRYDNSLIVLMSDHGESFNEHRTFSHGFDLNLESTHIVFIVKFPHGGAAGERVKERASLIDLMPTVLAQAGVDPKLDYELLGVDLARLAAEPEREPRRRLHGEISRWDGNDIDLVSVIDEDGYKLVKDVSVLPGGTATKESLGLWDTRTDPEEEHDLSDELPVRAAYDEQLIARWLLEQRQWRTEVGSEPYRVDIPEGLRKELVALGYVGGGVGAAGRKTK